MYGLMNSDLRVDIAAAMAAIDHLRPCLDTLERTHTPAAAIRVRVGVSSERRNLDALYNDLQAWLQSLSKDGE